MSVCNFNCSTMHSPIMRLLLCAKVCNCSQWIFNALCFKCKKGEKIFHVFHLPEFDVLQSCQKGGISDSQLFGGGCCSVLQNSLSVRSASPLEKSLWTEKQRDRTPEMPVDIGAMCYFGWAGSVFLISPIYKMEVIIQISCWWQCCNCHQLVQV